LLREDHREGKRVIKKTIANLSKWPSHVVEGLRDLIMAMIAARIIDPKSKLATARGLREELLKATEEKLEAIRAATQRKSKPLRGSHEIGIRVGKIINKHKEGKHFSLTITEDGLSYQRRQQQIKDEALLDGFYVIRTSMSAEAITVQQTVATYNGEVLEWERIGVASAALVVGTGMVE